MHEQKTFSVLFQNLVRIVVDESKPESEAREYLDRFSEIYLKELQFNPKQLLSTLRDAEENLKSELGKSFYKTFVHRIEHMPEIEVVLEKNFEAEKQLEDIVKSLNRWAGGEEHESTPLMARRIVRPRHLLYYIAEKQTALATSVALSVMLGSDYRSSLLINSPLRFVTHGQWVNLPIERPSEEDVDDQFLRYLGARNMIAQAIGEELKNFAETARNARCEVVSLNSDISELVDHVEGINNWAERFVNERLSPRTGGV